MDERENDVGADSALTQDTPESQKSPDNDFMSNPDIVAYIELKVQEGIKKALQGNAPKANTTDPTEQERKNFEKMTYKERLNLFQSNPQAYNKLTKGIN